MCPPPPPGCWLLKTDGKLYGVWRCLLMAEDSRSKRATMSPAELLQALRRMRASARLWVVIMLTGGHLAAAVFRMHSSGDSGGDAGADASDTAAAATTSASASTAASAAGGKSSRAPAAPSGSGSGDGDGFSVLDHKTFHRYVVRAKAGGKQSSKDATGKVAHSAGSALRRYNESALERDIHELLASWKHHIDAADLVFVHAPSSNGKTLFAEGQKTLAASDPRVRRIPFVSRRPTYAEVQRCVRLLCQVVEVPPLPAAAAPVPEASGGTAADAAAEQLRGLKVSGPAGTKAIEPTADSDGEEEEEKEEEPGVQPSALHLAARAGDATTVASLLEAGADPCARDARGKTPYMLAVDKATRDEFRRFMGRRPGQWDYAAAAIPSALTDDMEAAQQAKKAEKKAKMKAREAERKRAAAEGVEERKARAAAALDAEIAAAAAAAAAVSAKMDAASKAGPLPSSFSSSAAGRAKPKVGGGGGGGAKAGSGSSGSARRAPSSSSSSSSAQPPSAEELARRREMMAAAAEARMKALQAAAAQQKLW